MMEPQSLKEYLESRLPGARIAVHDMTGTKDHFEIEIVSDVFEGRATLERHRSIHNILAPLMDQAVHAVRLRTRTPGENEKAK